MESFVDSCSGDGTAPQELCIATGAPLGTPIPCTTHAVSVSLPRWCDVVGYEEGDPAVLKRLQAGYPRFVFHPFVEQLFRTYTERFARCSNERAIAFISLEAAERCVAFLARAGFRSTRIEHDAEPNLYVVLFPEQCAAVAKAFWQHTGWIVSSRRAEAIVAGRIANLGPSTEDVQSQLCHALARLAGVDVGSVSLFPSGMAAIDAAHQVVLSLAADNGIRRREGIQFGFPYLDTLKVQEKFGFGVQLLGRGDSRDVERLAALVAEGRVSHVFTEVPCNPLLQTPPLAELSRIVRPHGIPLIVDDTIGTLYNIDVTSFADIIVTSLTKFISGRGDVAAGSLIVNPVSPLAPRLLPQVKTLASLSHLFVDDAAVLLSNCIDFSGRMARINANAEALAEYLRGHPQVKEIFYPKFASRREYDALKTPHGGYGGLLSLVLHDSSRAAPKFYDALQVCKGPGLGSIFTLACPYTLLAHYRELEWAEAHGVSRYLIRVSVGAEDKGSIINTFDRALRESV